MDTIVVDGGGCRHWAKRSSDSGQRAEQLGILVTSGLIVGESLFGVMLAAVIVARSTAARHRRRGLSLRPFDRACELHASHCPALPVEDPAPSPVALE
jgi:hypothetical protein